MCFFFSWTAVAGKRCPDGRQTVLVSATLTPAVLQGCSAWCPDLVPVSVAAPVQVMPRVGDCTTSPACFRDFR